jgi:hypothetical protein
MGSGRDHTTIISMKLVKIRETFWINPTQVTDAWIQSNAPGVLRFRLASDETDSENILQEKGEIEAFCAATGFQMPSR